MKKITLLLVTMFFCLSGFAQSNFEVPEDAKFENAEDYKALEQDVLKAIDWLCETPVNEQPDKRTQVNTFLIRWLSGSPNVHIEIKPEIVTFIGGDNPQLLMMFMAGWAKYSLETEDYDNKVAGSLAGIDMLIGFYEKNRKSLSKDKNIEKYIKMKKKGELEEYVRKNA